MTEPQRTLHEAVYTNFNKTPSGKIYEKELKDIFCTLIICLNLNGDAKSSFLGKSHPYTFQTGEALKAMQSLSLSIELATTITTISYSIKSELGFALLRRFFDAKCLHCPMDRSRSEPKQGSYLQPTAKGVALVLDFCKNVGMAVENFPSILNLSYNTVELFKFDRNSLTDKIMYSDYFVVVLFAKLMGPRPNVWSPTNKPESFTALSDSEEFQPSFIFSLDQSNTFSGFEGVTATSKAYVKKPHKRTKEQYSPYHHRYFTNPESDAHSQYYVSTTGVRLFADKHFQNSTERYCVSGKAICQWLCDCTDIMNPRHAVEIGQLLLKHKLLRPVVHSPSIADFRRFKASRNAFYGLTHLGKALAWNNRQVSAYSSSTFDLSRSSPEESIYDEHPKLLLGLKDVIRDPGTRYLFKKHLEKEFCSENLEAYLRLNEFSKLLGELGEFLEIRRKYSADADAVRKIDIRVLKLSNVCLSLAYNVFFTYLGSESPFLLNIDYNLRQQIAMLMTNPGSATQLQTELLLTPSSRKGFDFEVVSIGAIDAAESNSVTVKANDGPSTVEVCPEAENTNGSRQVSALFSESSQTLYNELLISTHSPIGVEDANITFKNLAKVAIVFEKIQQHIYRLMEIDSFPKFVNSKIYRNATYNINFEKR